MTPRFVHLRLHSEFSLVDGLVQIKPLVKRLRELAMPATAITEQGNLFSLVKLQRAALAEGIKPITGADVFLYNPDDPALPWRCTLLAQNAAGYQRLAQLISRAHLEQQHQAQPCLLREWLVENNQGLLMLSGALEGDVGRAIRAGNLDAARAAAAFWQHTFGNRYYLELQRLGKPDEEHYIHAALDIAAALQIPVVATNDVRFLYPEDFEAHEIRVCIHQGRVLDDPRRPRDYTPAQYLRSAEEMAELFADIPEALANTVEIAKRCTLELTLGKNYLPDYPVPAGMTPTDYFKQTARQGLAERLRKYPPVGTGSDEERRARYETRLENELDVIVQMGFPGYFLIVADFIQWAKQAGIPVGPGRGSGAGSLVAYALSITDLDPIEFDLLFERFLNPERVSMPDFDIDFCMARRDEVIDYVAAKYGRDRVSQIITYGSMAAKAVVRDVGRVLGYGYGFVDKLAKLIPFELGITLDKALADSAELKQLYETDEEVKALIDMARKLEGLARNAGKHAGGVVIAPSPLTDFTPLYCEAGSSHPVTQFDKDDVEAIGLVKFDFLGLRTLTIIDWALATINRQRQARNETPIDITQIPRDDPQTYELLKNAQTTAVFQLESRGMKELIRKLKPDCFDDIIALVALFRPGPLESGMVDDYIRVKHGAKAEYAHPLLEPILRSTNGVILYQEQVMQIAREMAGYTLGGADLLRRAMGKKKPEEMAKQRETFTQGAAANDIDSATAHYIFDLMEKFAGYGFNKSHSAAYALVAYQTAWLKTHYPAAFMAAVLSADMDNTDKVVVLIEECREMKLPILPPDINLSQRRFTVDDAQRILYGLGAIKGVGETAIDEILTAREQGGPFRGMRELCQRVSLSKVNRRVLEALIKAGAFDGLGVHRAALLADLPTALKIAEQHAAMRVAGQSDLFFLNKATQPEKTENAELPTVEPWSEEEKLAQEKQTLGLYLSGHPIDPYRDELTHLVQSKLANLPELYEKSRGKVTVRVAGLVIDLRTRQNKQGKTMAFLLLDDRSGRLEVAVYSEVYERYRALLGKDALLVVEGSLIMDDFTNNLRLTAETLETLAEARARAARCLTFEWHASPHAPSGSAFAEQLEKLLAPFVGDCPVVIHYNAPHAKTSVQLGERWRIRPCDELIGRLKRWPGVTRVAIHYR